MDEIQEQKSARQVRIESYRSARRTERAEARDPHFGASANDFDSLPGTAMRLYYGATTFRLDPDGDERLAAAHNEDIFATPMTADELGELSERPHYLLKVDIDQQRASTAPDLLFLNYKRPSRYAATKTRDRAVPFEQNDFVQLFRDAEILPSVRGTILDFGQPGNYDAASGVLLLRIENE
jgi:hypothetical protein